MVNQSEIDVVLRDLSTLEDLDLTYRSRVYSRYAIVEIDKTATLACEVIEKLREEVERLEGELAEVRAEAEAHNAAATQYEKDIAALREEVARG